MLASIPREHNKLPCIHGLSGTSLCSGCDPVYQSHYKNSIEIPGKIVFNFCIYFLDIFISMSRYSHRAKLADMFFDVAMYIYRSSLRKRAPLR